MNVFIVPSWYPSDSNPYYGIFIKEQIGMMANLRPEWKIGVSRWGQGDSDKLLWFRDHVRNIGKIKRHSDDNSSIYQSDFTEYYQPALSWTKKFIKGNLREIIRCNELNYQAHVLANGKPDVIMIQASYPGVLIGNYLSEKYRIPSHLHIRLGGFMFQRMLDELGTMRKELITAIRKCDLVTATSNFHANEIQKWVTKVQTLYNPVDINFFMPIVKSEDYILAIGRLEKEKGFDMLLEAFRDIPAQRLKIVGMGSQSKLLEKQIRKYDLDDKVELMREKSRGEISELIQKCQFLVLPSKYETFGNVILEAMACGKPVVATSCGGPQEIVPKDMGILTDVHVKGLSEGISQMIMTIKNYDSKVIRNYVEFSFSPSKWMDRLERMLRSIV